MNTRFFGFHHTRVFFFLLIGIVLTIGCGAENPADSIKKALLSFHAMDVDTFIALLSPDTAKVVDREALRKWMGEFSREYGGLESHEIKIDNADDALHPLLSPGPKRRFVGKAKYQGGSVEFIFRFFEKDGLIYGVQLYDQNKSSTILEFNVWTSFPK